MNYLIIGGGPTGLSAAWALQKEDPNARITLLEKTDRLGGWVQTSHEKGLLFEKGPRTFQLARSPHLLQLAQELGLELLFSDPSAQKRFLWHKGKLRSTSSFFFSLAPYLLKEMFIPKGLEEDESIYEFACRRFSPKIAELLFDPLTLGIYGGDIKKLSLRSCFPSLYSWEREKGSITKGLFSSRSQKKGLFTFKGGVETLISTLERRLNMEVVLNCSSSSAQDLVYQADRVIDARPPSLPKKSLWVVHLAYEEELFTKGFGYLVPSKEGLSLLGMIFDSVIFPSQGPSHILRLSAMIREEETHPEEKAIYFAKHHLKLRSEPLFTQSFFAKEALLQPEVGLHYRGGVSLDSAIERGFCLAQRQTSSNDERLIKPMKSSLE